MLIQSLFIKNQQQQRGKHIFHIYKSYSYIIQSIKDIGRMTVNSAEAVKSIQEAIKKDDHNQVFEYSKLLLRQSPDDEEYQQCFIISAFKINVVDELQTIFKNPPTKDSIKKLYAYYLYFIGDFEKAISYLNTLIAKSNNSSFKLLLAQSYFKINDEASSAKIMLELLKQPSKMEKQDLQMYLINLFATSINQNLDQKVVNKYKYIMKQNYCRETYYNYALLFISLEDYKSGMQALNIFEKFLVKGQDDSDICMVNLFKDYINYKISKKDNYFYKMNEEQVQKKVNEYAKMEEQVSDYNLKSVIRNNKTFLKYQNNEHILQNFHQILRVIDDALQKKSKTTKMQQFILKLNKFTILVKKNRLVQASKILKDLQANYQSYNLSGNPEFIKDKYTLMKKNLKQSSKQAEEVLVFINTIAKLHKNFAFCLLADLKREEGNQKQLISQLKQGSQSSIVKNYIFSLLIKSPDLFEQYHEYLSELLEKTSDIKTLDTLYRLYENKQNIVKQEIILTKILKINPKDSDAKVKLAEIFINNGKVQQVEELLRGIQQPQQINDINYLQHIQKNIHISIKKDEEIQTIVPVGKKGGQSKQTISQAQTQALKRRIKKTRRPRYPKNMEKLMENFKGDPDRWLPKWQRKGYKKKGRKGAGKTQGLATVGKQQTKNVFTTNASTSAKEVTKDATKRKK